MRTIKDLAIDHPYYSSESNFYKNGVSMEYNTWQDYYAEFHDADIDMNLIFRWDIKTKGNEDGDEIEGYYMELFVIHQRKGIYRPITVKTVEDKDVAQIEEFLKPYLERLIEMWKPIS